LSPPHESPAGRTIERDTTAGYYFAIEDAILGERLIPLQAVVSIGRDAKSDIRLSDPYISKRHALVRLIHGKYVIEDLGFVICSLPRKDASPFDSGEENHAGKDSGRG
jgi:pSer/pThr/pTyr-binding forkhead associated (FHA) protein